MTKYTGDAVIGVGLKVQTPKPLDDRSVVANIQQLYSINPKYAYEGMTISNLDNGNIYMLRDKTKISSAAGWKASYESIQIQTCTEDEYKEWLDNTNADFTPKDESKTYIHQDTYYYIWEESLSAETEMDEYLKASWGKSVEDILSTKATNAALILTNNNLAALQKTVEDDYATTQYVIDNYVPLSFIEGTEGGLTGLLNGYYTKDESNELFVTKDSLKGDIEGEEGDYIFVTNNTYQADRESDKTEHATALASKVGVASDASLNSLAVTEGISGKTVTASENVSTPKITNGDDSIEIKEGGLQVNTKKVALEEQLIPMIVMSRAEYDAEEEHNSNAYYFLYNTDETQALVTAAELLNYYTKAQIDSKLTALTKLEERIAALEALHNTGE